MKFIALALVAFVGGAVVSQVSAKAEREDEMCRRFRMSKAGAVLTGFRVEPGLRKNLMEQYLTLDALEDAFCPKR